MKLRHFATLPPWRRKRPRVEAAPPSFRPTINANMPGPVWRRVGTPETYGGRLGPEGSGSFTCESCPDRRCEHCPQKMAVLWAEMRLPPKFGNRRAVQEWIL